MCLLIEALRDENLKVKRVQGQKTKPEEKEERKIQRLDRGMDWTMDRDKASLHQYLRKES